MVPVVNENDTTATDEITFGDNDFLSAQVAILLEARLLVLLTDTAGLHTADPLAPSAAELIDEVTDFAQLERYEIGDRTSAFGLGGMRSKVRAAEMASAAGIPVVICDGTAAGTLARAAAGERVGTRFAALARARPELQAVAALREARPGRAWSSTPARPACCASAGAACCPWGSRRWRASSPPETRSRSRPTAIWSARGSSTTRPPSWPGSRA